MGHNTSKSSTEPSVSKDKSIKSGSSDPRSPTPEITRTPLQANQGGSKHNITKNIDLRKTFENTQENEKLIHNNPILSAVIKNHLQYYDPRSPTQDFERTPIVINSNNDELNHKIGQTLQNDNIFGSPSLQNETSEYNSTDDSIEPGSDIMIPKNLCNGFFDMTLNEDLKENEVPLGSSTASNEAIETNLSNVSKPTKLLETNFDYIDGATKNTEAIIKNDVVDKNYKIEEKLENIPVYKILDVDPRSPSIEIERTPIVVEKVDADSSDDNVEDMSDDTLIKVLQNTNVELRQGVSKILEKNNEGLLIYEDDTPSLIDTPRKSSGNGGSRTPLSCMKNKTEASQLTKALIDAKSKKKLQKNLPKRSHIPRLKSLSKCSKVNPTVSSVSLKSMPKSAGINYDCENTPPHSHRDKWDKDQSIVL